jgi:hypothetical protein
MDDEKKKNCEEFEETFLQANSRNLLSSLLERN